MTAMQLTVMALLLIICALVILLVWALDRRDRQPAGTYMTASTRRRLRRMRRDLARARTVRR